MSSPIDVLLVDDDAADAALVEAAFDAHRLPGVLHHVGDGVEALEYLRREGPYAGAAHPDLVLLDLNMPRMNGHEVLAVIKADETLKTIPVVVFTTSSVDGDVLASYGAYANAYVTKPLDLDDFDHVVHEIHRFYGSLAIRPAPPGG